MPKPYDPNRSLKEQILDFGADTLDDTVIEEAQNMANACNQDGLKAQIEFLTTQRGFSEEAIYNIAAGIESED